MKAAARSEKARRSHLLQVELDELGRECSRIVELLRKLKRVRKAEGERSAVLTELSTSILHLHVHTKGLDRLIDELDGD